MPLTDDERHLCLSWFHSTHLAEPCYGRELDRALHRFRESFDEAGESKADSPAMDLGRISNPTTSHFTFANGMINRWPLSTRRIINHSNVVLEHSEPLPFHTWAQPKYLERRKEAISV